MAERPPAFELPLWLQLNKVSKKYMEACAARLGHLGIKRHYFLLVAIAEGNPPKTQQELADLLETDKVIMVGILNSLCDNGFIRRAPSKQDRRKHLIVLTPKGERILPQVRKVIAELNRRALSGLPDDLASHFPAALLRMKSELEKTIEESRRRKSLGSIGTAGSSRKPRRTPPKPPKSTAVKPRRPARKPG
jgi:DNA-binding MarR family transcriptional regulator